MARLGVAPLLGLALVMAGCIAQPAPAPEVQEFQPAQVEPPQDFTLAGTGCLEGGGHSVHPRRFADMLFPEPWVAAEILDDVGPQVTYSETPHDGVPSRGNTWGNYHATVTCQAWTLDGQDASGLVFGFVGARVDPPPFDLGGAARHYLITVIGVSHEPLAAFLHERGFHASAASGVAEWRTPAPRTMFYNLLDTSDHGVYESAFATQEVGAMEDGITRLWFQKENEDGTFSPVSLDMRTTGASHLWAQPNGYFSHLRTNDHDPLPGAAGQIAGFVLDGFDRVITLGPAHPELRLDEAYIHL